MKNEEFYTQIML